MDAVDVKGSIVEDISTLKAGDAIWGMSTPPGWEKLIMRMSTFLAGASLLVFSPALAPGQGFGAESRIAAGAGVGLRQAPMRSPPKAGLPEILVTADRRTVSIRNADLDHRAQRRYAASRWHASRPNSCRT